MKKDVGLEYHIPAYFQAENLSVCQDIMYLAHYDSTTSHPLSIRLKGQTNANILFAAMLIYFSRTVKSNFRISDVADIRRIDKLHALFTFIAARSSKLWNIADISASLEISKESVENYISALEAMYLFDRVPAWTARDYDRAVKRPKWFIGDTGLMCAELKWREADAMFNPDMCGKLVESWAYHGLASAVDSADGFSIFHYRDREQREIDFILENEAGELAGIEVKAGSLVGTDDFRHMDWFARTQGKGRWKRSIVLYSGHDTISFGPGRIAVPLAALFA